MDKTFSEELMSVWKYLYLVFDSIRRTEEWKSRMKWLLGLLFLILVLDCFIFISFTGFFPNFFVEYIYGIASEIKNGLIILSLGIFSLVFIFPYVLFRESAKIYENQENSIDALKEKYESENPNIRIEEFNSAEKKISGIVIFNENQNFDVIDASVLLVAMVEHQTNEAYKEVGQIINSFDHDNCHFEQWANEKNVIVAKDKNVLYFAGLNEGKEHLFLTKGFDLENHSAPFVSSKDKQVVFGRYDLYFDVIGKIDKNPKKPFRQSFRAELGFTRNIEAFVKDDVLNLKDEVVFTLNNIIQIVDSRKPLAVVLVNH